MEEMTEQQLLNQRESIHRELLRRHPNGYLCPDCAEYGVCGRYGEHPHDPTTGEEIKPTVRL